MTKKEQKNTLPWLTEKTMPSRFMGCVSSFRNAGTEELELLITPHELPLRFLDHRHPSESISIGKWRAIKV
jgi:hypothetical protein